MSSTGSPRRRSSRPRRAATELGETFYTRRQDSGRYKDKLIAWLAKLGYIVTVEPAQAAQPALKPQP
jgi:hypothetical protein